MSNIENQKIETVETAETSQPEQGIDMNDRVEATGQSTSETWEGEIEDLPDHDFEPTGNDVTNSYAHESVSRTEFDNAPNVKEDFNKAGENIPEVKENFNDSSGAGGGSDGADSKDHNLDPPDSPAPS